MEICMKSGAGRVDNLIESAVAKCDALLSDAIS